MLVHQSQGNRTRNAFTLIELLVVIVVIGVIIAIAAPGLVGTMGGMRVSQAGEMIAGEVSAAQAAAQSINRPIEVRFYKVPSVEDDLNGTAGGSYRGILLLEYYHTGEVDPRTIISGGGGAPVFLSTPLAVVRKPISVLPNGVVISEQQQLSSLFSAGASSTSSSQASIPTIVRRGTGFEPYDLPSSEYHSLVIYPDSTNLNSAGQWFVTVVPEGDLQKAPADLVNFFTVQIDPVNSRLSLYRP